jgi:hypothetical protein
MTLCSIRQVEAKDLDACYATSLATGLAGGDASHLYCDPRMMGFTSPRMRCSSPA